MGEKETLNSVSNGTVFVFAVMINSRGTNNHSHYHLYEEVKWFTLFSFSPSANSGNSQLKLLLKYSMRHCARINSTAIVGFYLHRFYNTSKWKEEKLFTSEIKTRHSIASSELCLFCLNSSKVLRKLLTPKINLEC